MKLEPSIAYKKGAGVQLSKHFTSTEFDCHCGVDHETLINPKLVELLEAVRLRVEAPLLIHSGHRCAAKQAELRASGIETAKGPSTHEMGWAADFAVPGYHGVELALLARFVGFMAVGTAKHWIHADLRGIEPPVQDRRWNYST